MNAGAGVDCELCVDCFRRDAEEGVAVNHSNLCFVKQRH